ncbi:conserved hypothetical protein [Anaeromyxobacter sp. K]|uniref:hypothetical protein n=1 Tax=Anaeromyxobacter sp. (strain K) TaxID=447217 RepID=UPI00015F893D|nr:hypothetical protein [Anaeromyxobacter sp. K]ACG73208.1 conserved hypothetical protein [Anaeromyxobacter sp. K]
MRPVRRLRALRALAAALLAAGAAPATADEAPAPGAPPAAAPTEAAPDAAPSDAPSSATAGPSSSATVPAAPPAPSPAEAAPQPAEPPPSPPPDPSVPPEDTSPPPYAEDTWLDVGHAFLEERLFAPVLVLDRFFSDERDLEAERARSFLRVRNALRVHQRGTPAYALDVRASLRLPGLNRRLERLRLVIVGQAEDVVNGFYPELTGATPLGPNQQGAANAELRYGAWDGLYSHVDLGAGLLLELPVGAFGRVRYRASVPLGRWFLGRMALAGFWRTDTRLGTSLDASVERPLGSIALLRLAGTSRLTQRSRGVEWGSELAGLRALGPRTAVSLAASVEGATDAPADVDRYRVYARLRRDLYRRWIFYELEPEVAWPWEAERGGRFREYAITFRLEVQLQGSEPPVEPPAELPEPRDPPHLRPSGAQP